MLTLSVFFAGLTAWLLLGSLPITAEVRGVIMPLGGIREISNRESGLVTWVGAQVGSEVKVGDLLFRIRNEEAQLEYVAARDNYIFQRKALERERIAFQEKKSNDTKRLELLRQTTSDRLLEAQEIKIAMDVAVDRFLDKKLAALVEERESSKHLTELIGTINDSMSHLVESGVMSKRQVIQNLEQQGAIERILSQVDVNIFQTDLEAQRLNLELNSVRSDISRLSDDITRLNDQIKDGQNQLSLKLAELAVRDLALEQSLLNAERRVWHSTHVLAPYDGQIMAVKRGVGQTVDANSSIGLMNLSAQKQRLLLVLSSNSFAGFLDFSIGERSAKFTYNSIDRAEALHTTLSFLMESFDFTVEPRGLDTFIISSGSSNWSKLSRLRLNVSSLKDSMGLPVFSSLVEIGSTWAPDRLVNVGIIPAKHGKQVRVGAVANMKPDFEPAMIGAQASGRVTSVSALVQTSIEIEGLVGSSELADRIFGQQPGSIVIIALDQNEDGDPIWIRGPPEHSLTIGTTTRSRIEIQTISPLRVIVPFFARLFET
jgi:multidrug efflux pump subunit AcrA (membrane-fusion protein)